MRIRTQLLALVTASLATGVLAAFVIFAAGGREDAAADAQARAQVAEHEVAGLLALTQEYARYAEPRAAQQWHLRHAAIAAALDGEAHPLPGAALVELRNVTLALPALFTRLEELPRNDAPFTQRRKEALLDQLLTNTQAMSDYAYQWFQDAVVIRRDAEREFRWIAFSAPIAMLAMLVASGFVVRQRVLKPMRRLDQAAAAIRRGDLSFRLASESLDEFGDLSREFDAMTAALVASDRMRDRSEQQLRAITENLPVSITYIDAEERYRFVNRTGCEWLRTQASSLVGQRLADVMPREAYERRREYLRRALRGERVSFEIQTTGELQRDLSYVYLPDIRPDGSVAGLYGLGNDVSALKKVERQLGTLVRSDVLTGLANRYQFNEALPLALARARRSGRALAVMYLDIDRFKSINDSLGHAAGDEVLKAFASRIAQSVRETDSVARLGGDEFVIVLEGLHSEEEPQFVARKIIASVTRPLEIEGRVLLLTTSIGIAFCARVEATDVPAAQALLARADEALYAAKNAGRNTWRVLAGAAPQADAAVS